MIDRCGRNIDYLRISVTDRCNLRCIYCMPEEGVQHVERSLVLQEEEILRICRVMAELGIRKIKLTGGEPLVRPRMPKLVEKLKNMPGIEKVTLTTNGVLLKDQMRDFARAGLDGLNISLDTLDETCSRRITRRDELGRTLEGISEALKYPEISLKINCVPLGIPEAMRAFSLTITKRAMLSRGTAGIRKGTLIVNLPGSPKAVRECLEVIIDALGHGIEILTGEAGECGR